MEQNSFYDDYLAHYGVLGMKWGRRRAKRSVSNEHARAKSLKKKKTKYMTNDEIREYTQRVNLERQFKEAKKANRKGIAKVMHKMLKKSSDKSMDKVAEIIATEVAKQISKQAGK